VTFFKLRHKETGLFSVGGIRNQFTKKGKTWSQIGHVKCHLSAVKKGAEWYRGDLGETCQKYLDSIELVEYTLGDPAERVIPF